MPTYSTKFNPRAMILSISIVRNLLIPIKSLKPISYTFALSFPHYNVINPAYKFKILKKIKRKKFEI